MCFLFCLKENVQKRSSFHRLLTPPLSTGGTSQLSPDSGWLSPNSAPKLSAGHYCNSKDQNRSAMGKHVLDRHSAPILYLELHQPGLSRNYFSRLTDTPPERLK